MKLCLSFHFLFTTLFHIKYNYVHKGEGLIIIYKNIWHFQKWHNEYVQIYDVVQTNVITNWKSVSVSFSLILLKINALQNKMFSSHNMVEVLFFESLFLQSCFPFTLFFIRWKDCIWLNFCNSRYATFYDYMYTCNTTTKIIIQIHSASLGRFVPHHASAVWRKAPLHRTIFRLNLEKIMAAPISMLTSSTIDGCDFYNPLQLFGNS